MEQSKELLIWLKYREQTKSQSIIRSGFGLLGIYDYDPKQPRDSVRRQSVAEHILSTVILAILISVYYPEVIPRQELLKLIILLIHHEVGENVLGDVPDDGDRDEKAKDQAELEAICAYCEDFPAWFGDGLQRTFTEFQNKESPYSQLAYCIDKSDAVLRGLIYEAEGHGGSVLQRATERDRHYMQVTGTSDLVDCWAAHYLDVTDGLYGADICWEIICKAVENVRGKGFTWLEK